jgi:hypothetical protein
VRRWRRTASPCRHAAGLQFVIEAKRLIRTVVTTRQEDVEVAMPMERDAWTLPKSIFAPRAKRGPQQCDAKDFFDTPKVVESMFDTDWARLMAKVCPADARQTAAFFSARPATLTRTMINTAKTVDPALAMIAIDQAPVQAGRVSCCWCRWHDAVVLFAAAAEL